MGTQKIICLLILLLLFGVSYASCGDLDDGISKFTDDNINKWDDLGKKERNVTYIKLNARSQASVRSKNGTSADGSTSGGGTNNMNSVVLGAGGTIRGDVIIIDDSRGDKTQVAQ